MADNFQIEPPAGLLPKIMKRIRREERILLIKRVVAFSVTLVASFVAFFPVINMLVSDFTDSGFFNFFSLAFSDFSLILAYWQSFAMILLQTLPALSLALFLAVLVTFLQSARSLAKDVKKIIKVAV